ncbi:MAG: FKBP-type peptidyl-prolyl cis-trans isomerase [Alphaproteobacteria bacterium]|nr:FKBP-type peptidyl-prolyl cis-trans isomerase [Alphaproteobacteria bacterium]
MKKTLLSAVLLTFCLAQPTFSTENSNMTKEENMTNTAENTTGLEIVPGLSYTQNQAGTGAKPKNGDMVSVHYVGTLTDGTRFDSSRDRGEPITFKLGVGQVIQGWDKGIAAMSIGERGVLTIAPELGYGDHGAGHIIPGGATLVFDVELVSIN